MKKHLPPQKTWIALSGRIKISFFPITLKPDVLAHFCFDSPPIILPLRISQNLNELCTTKNKEVRPVLTHPEIRFLAVLGTQFQHPHSPPPNHCCVPSKLLEVAYKCQVITLKYTTLIGGGAETGFRKQPKRA